MFLKYSDKKSWLILIHGLGVSENIWSKPDKEKMKYISFKTLLKEEKETISFVTRFGDCYNIASWSQDPLGSIYEAAEELKDLASKIEGSDFTFIAHSRGGLVARLAIQRYGLKPRALICLATPHCGSNLANFVMKYMPLIRLLVPDIVQNRASINELRTDASLIQEVNMPENYEYEKNIPHFDLCGYSPKYFNWGPLNIIGSAESFFGSRVIDEWKEGAGDGFVSVSSAISPLTPENNCYLLPVNHANILINVNAFNIVSDILKQY